MPDLLDVARARSVRVLTLHRPDVLNALDTPLGHQLLDARGAAKYADGVVAVMLTGAAPAFCPDDDPSDIPPHADAAKLAERHRAFVELVHIMVSFLKPVVAAVNGAAVGASATVSCDGVVMADVATLHLCFVSVGLPLDMFSISLLRNRTGFPVALALAGRLGVLPSFTFATTKSMLRRATMSGDAIVDIDPFTVGASAASNNFINATTRYRR